MFCFLSIEAVAASELSLSLKDKRLAVFSGGVREIQLLLKNGGPARSVELEYRVFQLAGAVAAPLGGRVAWKSLPLNAGQTVLETVSVSLPEVKAETRFAIKIFQANGAGEIGAVTFLGYPTNLLAQLKEPLRSRDLALFDEKDLFAPALTKAGIQFTRVRNLTDPILADKPIVLVSTSAIPDGDLADLSKIADVIFYLGTVADRLPVEETSRNKAFIVRTEGQFMEDFDSSPHAQKMLIVALRSALRRARGLDKDDGR